MALHVLRKVSQATIDELHNPNPAPGSGEEPRDFLYLDKNKLWFSQRYLDDEAPRDQYTNGTIIEGTEGFALWSDGEGVVATFDNHGAALDAKNSARMTFKTEVDLPAELEAPVKEEKVAVKSGAAAS